VIQALQDEERARNKPATATARTGRAPLSEAQRAANEVQREQNQLIDELTAAYDRATQSEAGLLAIRARRLQFSETEIQELLTNQALTQEAEKQTRQAQEAQQAYEALYTQLQSDVDAYNHALAQGISLEQARQEMAIEAVARSEEELQILLEKNDARRAALALVEEEAARRQAMAKAAESIEADVREPGASAVEEAQKDFDALQEISASFTRNFLEQIHTVTETGKFAFKDFADSVIQDLLRILQQQFLKPAMEGWIQAGLQLATGVLGGVGGGATGAATGALSASTIAAGGGTIGLQHGGPLRRGVTLVGEAGPEVIATSRDGRAMVYPTSHPLTRMAVRGQTPGRASGGPLPQVVMGATGSEVMQQAAVPVLRRQYGGTLPQVVMGATGPDIFSQAARPVTRRQFGGPLPSAVMGATGSEVPSQPSATGPGHVAPVIVNVYAQDAASFIKSKGEIQRQMQSAFRSAQRS
jgi:hypothetical protein